MTDRPILFSAPMVRALNEGRKTQTRRILNPQPFPWAEAVEIGPYDGYGAPGLVIQRTLDNRKQMGAGVIRFAPGDRLYVREAHYLTDNGHEEYAVFAADRKAVAEHLASVEALPADFPADVRARHLKLRPGIHLPRWASRLTLTVTDLRIERLKDCSEADAEAEGCVWDSADGWDVWYVPGANMPRHGASATECFSLLWDSINGAGAWEANPWVVAVSFTVEHRNIDA